MRPAMHKESPQAQKKERETRTLIDSELFDKFQKFTLGDDTKLPALIKLEHPNGPFLTYKLVDSLELFKEKMDKKRAQRAIYNEKARLKKQKKCDMNIDIPENNQ